MTDVRLDDGHTIAIDHLTKRYGDITVLSGVTSEVSVLAAAGAIALWAIVPATVGLIVVQRRDIV